ncbi:serine/threonine-protein kinase [Streptomyces sp. NPDC054784]
MMNHGGPVDEPTSYGLQPPEAAEDRQHQPGGIRRQPRQPRPGDAWSYEPTEVVATADPPRGDGRSEGGRLLGGRYRLDARLGQGGMGTVWRAHDQVVGRAVAVKEPRVPDHLSDSEQQTMYQRMNREARAAAQIDHPSVVTVHDVVVEDGRPWLVMELVKGRSLGDQLAEGTLGAREAARIGLDVLGALAATHEAGVLHRDVKPDNVLLGRYDRVVLSDFGIAHVEGEKGLTETGAFVGSPEFVAPERVQGQRPGPESDLWSLGVVLYVAMEGVSPFRRSNTPATLQAVVTAEPQMPTRATGAFGAVIMQLLRKDPAARPGVADLRRTLEEVARPPQPLGGAASGNGDRNTGLAGATRSYGRALRDSRKAQFGTGATLVAAMALVLLVVDPFADDGAPGDWKKYDEDKRVRASLSVPADYQRSVDDHRVTYRDPGGVFTVQVDRETGIEKSALGSANGWKEFYEDGADEDYVDTMADVESRVTEARHQNQEAADILTTWHDPAAATDDTVKDVVYRRHELLVINEDNVRWRFYVDMPAKGAQSTEGEKIFENVRRSLDIDDL